MPRKSVLAILVFALCCVSGLGIHMPPAHAINTAGDYEALPPFLTSGVPPLVMLVMGRDHKLYYEAYNDASDIDQDGTLDIRYDTDIDYYGYFDSYKCYKYDSSNTRFYPYSKTTDKKCNKAGASGTYNSALGEWSGNFLNYITMTRMDTVRRVLYGGTRSYDGTETTSSSVVLERSFIPQDAHSWGKEYDPRVSGVSIAMVAPLAEPSIMGNRHMFACTTLTGVGSPPLLRVAKNTDEGKRIWDWVSKERPVVDNSITTSTGSAYNSYPNNHSDYDYLVFNYGTPGNQYKKNVDVNAVGGATYFATSSGVSSWEIFGSGNPWGDNYWPFATYNKDASDQQNYLTIFNGAIKVSASGNYQFLADGDDAVEFIITGVTNYSDVNVISTGRVVASGYYGGHGRGCSAATTPGSCVDSWGTYGGNPSRFKGTVYLSRGATYDIEFRHQENAGDDNYYLYWKGSDSGNNWQKVPASAFNVSGVTLTQKTYNCVLPAEGAIDNYTVRVKVCDPNNDPSGSSLLEANCKRYPNGQYKPTGILQTHGEADRMYFGLLTGSYRKNTSGGVLRKNLSSFKDELNLNTGQFSTVQGIVYSINTFRITNFDYGSQSYSSNCGWIADRPINAGECRNWGNPIAEMMYETLRYFRGATTGTGAATPTTDFTYSEADDDGLVLPKPTWINPYSGTSSFSHCAKPFMLVISDVFPSFDSDQLPGVHSNFDVGFTGALTSSGTPSESLDVEDLANTIWTLEGESSVTPHFIAQVGTSFDGSCAPKTMTGFGNVRGLCPEEPTKRGSYYAASVAYFGRKNDMSGVTGTQNVNTYVVALASPLPRIEIPVAGKTITMVPFAKSVGGYGISSTKGQFQPTNSIVDFYVEGISGTSGVFRINYEDVEQGADHDMDAIAKYEYVVETDPTSGVSRVKVTMRSEYAAGSIIQHMGFTISGTTQDGTYLEIRDKDTSAGDDPDYFMDTPPGVAPYTSGSTGWQDGPALPTDVHPPAPTTRYFWVGTTTAATILKDPLWYAAKYGGFEELSGATVIAPDVQKEWDEDQDGTPDTYFYVVNPLKLEEQLNKSFAAILARVSSGTAASVISNSRSGEGAIYQSIFYATYEGEVSWVGEIHSFLVDAYGNMRVDTNENKQLDLDTDLIVEFNSDGLIDLWQDVDADGQLWKEADGGPDVQVGTNLALNNENVKFLWTTNTWLNEIDDANILNQRSYTATGSQRYLFTFVDQNQNMIADNGEQQEFTMPGGSPSALPSTADLTNVTKIYPYIQPYPPFTPPAYVTAISGATKFQDYLQIQTRRIMHYIRGADQGEYIAAASGYTIPAFRNRKVDYDSDGVKETWRLGDIIHSTPTVIGRPQENYDLIYYDLSYADYYTQYVNRRSLVYSGANDGMFHAFNGGFYDPDINKFITQPYLSGTTTPDTSYPAHALGSELWAYVPYNLLPHLHWLTDPNYAHIYYCDLKPKVFDAKVWDEGDTTHKNGWGTILVGGMRLGGGRIQADMNKTDGATFVTGTDRTMTSAFFILDITNPEAPPVVLAELSFPNLGYTTCYPTAIPMRGTKTVTTGVTTTVTFSENQWYLVFGSGPADSSGQATKDPLTYVSSSQPGKIFMVDLVELVKNKTLKTMNSVGTLLEGVPSIAAYASLDTNTFISDIISVDFDLDYNTDALYFGTVQGSPGAWGGKLRRIKIDDNYSNRSLWVGNSLLLDLTPSALMGRGLGQPITAAPSIALDADGNRWIYFGTGRFFTRADAENADQQSYYGLKEWKSGSTWLWWDIYATTELLNMSTAIVYEEGTDVDNVNNLLGGAVTDWSGLLSAINDSHGWYMDFSESKERNLGQATLLGDILTFTTYIPSLDPCEFEGYTNLYATYYKTGTAYFASVIGLGTRTSTLTGRHEVLRKTSLGRGLSLTPNIHTGREEGSKIFVQTSTGAIEVLQQANPGMTKSGRVSWKEE